MERREGSSASFSLPPLIPYLGTSLDLPIPSHTFITGLQGPTTLLDGTNYAMWSAGFRRFLEIHGRLSFLTDDPPSLEDPRFATWITQEQAVTSWLLKMAILTIVEPMQLLSPSKAIWDEWACMYGYRSNIGRTVEIVEGMFRARRCTRSLQEFYATLRSLLNQLEIYQPYTPDLTVQSHYREETAVGLFLAGIDPTLGAQIQGPILSLITLPTLGEAFSTALRVSSLGPVPTPLLTDSTALSSETRPRGRSSDNGGRGREKGRGRDGKLYPPYVHCQKFGHRSDKCWQKFGKPDQVAHSSTTDSASTSDLLTISREELARMLATRTPTDTLSTSGSHTSHLASTSTSGTSSLLSQIASLPHPETVTIADGRVCPVRGKGRSLPTPSLPLSDVLYVPNFPVNLLSISAITKSDLQTGKRIGLGRETGWGIYELVPDLPPTGFCCLLSQSDTSLQWHRRLGHPGITKLRQALPWLTLSPFDCESCQLGKHFRSTYSRRDSIPCTKPFDLVHCDVWGPSCVSSPSHFRYYIVFVDDFSRLSWVYLLHDRTDILSSVRQFLQEISTPYSSTPKILRTDNALELVQSALRDLCSSRGIIHQTTCPYTSQQNGVA
ncbi:uncharacterized protein LOC144706034 [Wolffia australiana]